MCCQLERSEAYISPLSSGDISKMAEDSRTPQLPGAMTEDERCQLRRAIRPGTQSLVIQQTRGPSSRRHLPLLFDSSMVLSGGAHGA